MDTFARKLRERAQQLGISNAEVARRCELDERRYAHYAAGRREPDLATLVKISKVLGTTPNWLLGLTPNGDEETMSTNLLGRLYAAAAMLNETELRILVVQAEAIAQGRIATKPLDQRV